MDSENYQRHQEQTIELLKDFEIKLEECMLNLMMYGEMSEWNKNSEEAEEIMIDNSLLEASSDKNVQELLRLHRTVVLVTSKMI
jgi:hypothetical protein